jgi:uncharacterized membrane protein YbaN (DUF454 family)
MKDLLNKCLQPYESREFLFLAQFFFDKKSPKLTMNLKRDAILFGYLGIDPISI